MTKRYDELERIERLRASGTLTDDEFAVEKARILSSVDETSGQAAPTKLPLILSIVGVLVAAGSVGAWVGLSANEETESVIQERKTAHAAPKTAPDAKEVPLSSLPEEEQLAKASLLVLGTARSKIVKLKGETHIFKAERILQLPFGPVLLVSKRIKDGCHACVGAIGVYYLKDASGEYAVDRKWPDAVEGWGWGEPPSSWAVSDKFTQYAAVYAEGGYTGQGITCSGATITELTPNGPVKSDLINTAFSDGSGYTYDEDLNGEPRPRELEGKITSIVKGRSFEVQVSGDDNFVERYAAKNGRFVRVSGPTRLGC